MTFPSTYEINAFPDSQNPRSGRAIQNSRPMIGAANITNHTGTGLPRPSVLKLQCALSKWYVIVLSSY